ncbi:DNA mismatch repair protein MutS [Paenibacillus melissococcoides]|uniref:DNA mismatch repair protein MutS n=1 Tax=Paenibacillus melissococcoides TaxID=2912268 RepID=A0ABN8U400_9BACL|nr:MULTISPECIES: DNA mismatch repair protein MutS [Paenibacillus]GIO78042.1 hypothetical protein J6TS7_16520 [Paenibacillus dendritiformis]CAH8245781.1 DNA mismatch repair protein MutS [Paenibacillus melissococcoides]CAH8712067.1 DNA mismatch repair protein MutS [Paenibacillus melissococcoides]CAH8712811.1 DNA mismatch repair protein MutS [Paenibacillus melissococcoides]
MDDKMMERLEYGRVKQEVMKYALSYAGQRHIEEMKPLTDAKAVQHALLETEEATRMLAKGASVPIPSLQGMDTVLSLLGSGYLFGEKDIAHVRQFLHSCSQLIAYMRAKAEIAPTVAAYAASMHPLDGVESEIDRCLAHGRIRDEASKELHKVRRKLTAVEDKIRGKIDALLSRYRSLMQENLVSQRNGRYVFPIKKEYRKQIKGSVVDESSSGQTVYVEPQELAVLQQELAILRIEEGKEEAKILSYLTELLEGKAEELRRNAETVGWYDYVFARGKYAQSIEGQPVRLNENGVVDLRQAKHPLLGGGTVPLDIQIGRGYRALIVTGPNTGGKTVALKTVGLLCLMVQSGLLVPAGEGSSFPVFRHIAADIGDGQSLEQSLSTFSAHITRVIDMLTFADEATLVLIDEMASGTDPGEGVALSIALLEELSRRGTMVIATTHYNEIKHFAGVTPGFRNARMEFDPDTLRPLYRLCIGEAGSSYAFLISRKLGLNPELIRRAEELAARREERPGLRVEAEAGTAAGYDAALLRAGDSPAESVSRPMPASVASAEVKEAASPENGAAENPPAGEAKQDRPLEIGDCVYISYLGRTGIVYEAADARGNVGVMIQRQKVKINHKRLSLYIEGKELYPEDYDMDIVFESKENRKKRKLMERKHVEGLSIVHEAEK